MQIFETPVPFDRKNRFFIKVLSGILVFCLLLVSIVFIMIYQSVKQRSLDQSYSAEQEVISNASYSASIMQDTAFSMLTQLSGDPKVSQLIYSMDTENLSTIHAMQLLRNYASASTWIDSIYIYCAKENRVCYSYVVNGKHFLSFCSLDDFFDKNFILSQFETSSHFQGPVMRTVQYRSTLPENTLFTYNLPVQNFSNSYDGLFIVNISAQRLLTLGYNITDSSERQFLIADDNGQVYTSGKPVLDASQQNNVITKILTSETDTGQAVIEDADAICTWTRSENTGLYFLSCVQYSTITNQLKSVTNWFLLFYISIVIFSILISFYLSSSINREYARLKHQYTLSEKRYTDNYSYIKHAILRSFFTLKTGDFIIGKQFSDNGISLEQYSGFALFLFQLRLKDPSEDDLHLRYRRTHFLLQEQIEQGLPQSLRFELVDMLQNRFLLVCEQTDPSDVKILSDKLRGIFTENAQISISGVYSSYITCIDQLPAEYRTLAHSLDLLYFYPTDSLIAYTELESRSLFGQKEAEKVRSDVTQMLTEQSIDEASQILSDFFDSWFEQTTDVPYTLDILSSGISEFISTFKRAYAVTMEYSPSRFRTELLRAENSRTVKRLFLDLMQDISCALASIHNRSSYIDELVNYMEENYADSKLNIDTLADHIGLSPSHIQTIFKAATGNSISVYLRSFRLNKARDLLEKTDIPISEIAEKTGFGNANYFYTVFKRYYSTTPTEYRAKRPNQKK